MKNICDLGGGRLQAFVDAKETSARMREELNAPETKEVNYEKFYPAATRYAFLCLLRNFLYGGRGRKNECQNDGVAGRIFRSPGEIRRGAFADRRL